MGSYDAPSAAPSEPRSPSAIASRVAGLVGAARQVSEIVEASARAPSIAPLDDERALEPYQERPTLPYVRSAAVAAFAEDAASQPVPRAGHAMRPALMPRRTPAIAEGFDHTVATMVVPRPTASAPVPLGPVEDLVLALVDGRRSLANIAALIGITSREVLALVQGLEDLALVELPSVSRLYVELDPDDLELELEP